MREEETFKNTCKEILDLQSLAKIKHTWKIVDNIWGKIETKTFPTQTPPSDGNKTIDPRNKAEERKAPEAAAAKRPADLTKNINNKENNGSLKSAEIYRWKLQIS